MSKQLLGIFFCAASSGHISGKTRPNIHGRKEAKPDGQNDQMVENDHISKLLQCYRTILSGHVTFTWRDLKAQANSICAVLVLYL